MTIDPVSGQCIEPELVRSSDIVNYVDNIGRPEFITHLSRCAFCRSEVSEFTALQTRLDTHLGRHRAAYRRDCLDVQQIGEYALRLLTGPARQQVKQHLDSCQYCSNEYRMMQQELAEPAYSTPKVPDLVSGATGALSGLLRRVLATPVTLHPEFEVRGFALPGEAGPRQYQAGDVLIVLQLQASGQSKARKDNLADLTGTVTGDNYSLEQLAGCPVKLLEGEQEISIQTLDEVGNFYLENIKVTSELNLELHLPDKIVVVDDLQFE